MTLAHLATKVFNTPLAIYPKKAEIVVTSLAARLGVGQVAGRVKAMEDDGWLLEPRPTQRRAYDVVGGIAVIEITGTLVQRLGSLTPWSGMTGYDGLRQNFITAMLDPDVKAIGFMIDSPGGEVAGCFDLVDTIFNARGTKPLWAILNENAYSAAYAIASACDYITVPRTGGTGSIGVIWMHYDFSKAIANAGLTVTILQYGQTKADGHPELPLSDDAKARLQADIDTMGNLFVSTVARNRGIDAAKVRATEAATYMGELGVAQGLADAVMPPDAAFRALVAQINKDE